MRFEIWVFVCCVMCISCHPLYGYNSMEGNKMMYGSYRPATFSQNPTQQNIQNTVQQNIQNLAQPNVQIEQNIQDSAQNTIQNTIQQTFQPSMQQNIQNPLQQNIQNPIEQNIQSPIIEQNIPENPSAMYQAPPKAPVMPNPTLAELESNPFYTKFLTFGPAERLEIMHKYLKSKINKQPQAYNAIRPRNENSLQTELSQTRNKVNHPSSQKKSPKKVAPPKMVSVKSSKLRNREKEGIMSELNSLQTDVKGFSTAMEGMAESVILGRDQGLKWQDQLQTNLPKTKRKKIIKQWITDTEKTQEDIVKQVTKLESRKHKFENEMVGFFTSYICGYDC